MVIIDGAEELSLSYTLSLSLSIYIYIYIGFWSQLREDTV